MNWNVAQAKQRLSEIIREAAREPQVIYNRNRPVAAVIAADELAAYRAWKAANDVQPRKTLAESFAELRRILQEEGRDGLDIPPRTTRPNAFAQMLEEEGLLADSPESGRP
ncbi:MAG: type II toxin-antitoxin system Phd/YefM family antitoxin [Dechloromonas sp.]|jgi:prevent-host-death family protein|nr:type II toxin-antitoxin system Phd/YefM family antitoxin [Dechloromonas sp.]MBN8463247.1 type II toxin-antitoxin system Phd/YefM family antitoxin [Dechloromonas sp.]